MSATAIPTRQAPVASAIRANRLIAVLRRVTPRPRLLDLVDELRASGVRLFEITLDGDDADRDLAAVRERLAAGVAADDRPCWVGAGTVRTVEQVRRALAAGAAFAVSPVLDRVVMDAALTENVPFIPGAYSPTEIDAAWRAGATFVKLFPGSSLGPQHVRELRGPLPEVETIVTGGIDAGNAVAFLEAGAVAVGMGSAIVAMSTDERRALVRSIGSVAGR